jgi:hypothetical protein
MDIFSLTILLKNQSLATSLSSSTSTLSRDYVSRDYMSSAFAVRRSSSDCNLTLFFHLKVI